MRALILYVILSRACFSGGTPDAATAIPELARESAAHGLIRLASDGTNADQRRPSSRRRIHRAAVAGRDVSGNHRHFHYVAGFATEAALRCFESRAAGGEPSPVRSMLSAKLRVRADIIVHARIQYYVNISHALLKMAD